MRKAWSEGEIEFLRLNYDKMLYRKIGLKLGKTRLSVKHKTQRLGLSIDPTKRFGKIHELSGLDWERLREFHAKGISDYAIARELRFDRRTVCYYRHKMGLPANYKGCPSQFSEEIFRTAYDAGLSRGQIAKIFGCTRITVTTIRWRLGLPIFRERPRPPKRRGRPSGLVTSQRFYDLQQAYNKAFQDIREYRKWGGRVSPLSERATVACATPIRIPLYFPYE